MIIRLVLSLILITTLSRDTLNSNADCGCKNVDRGGAEKTKGKCKKDAGIGW